MNVVSISKAAVDRRNLKLEPHPHLIEVGLTRQAFPLAIGA